MRVEEGGVWFGLGQKIGYLLSFSLSTAILYFLLHRRLPEEWTILHLGVIVMTAALSGYALRRWFES